MSNTVITNFRDASGPRSSADSPFVVVLERDGTISLDNAALEGLVGSDGSQSAGISVVRVGQEGKPDDATDSENEDDSVPHVTLTVDGFYDDPNGIAKYDSGIEMLQSLSNETREHSLIGFQNDHCYTSLTSPSQSLPSHSASEISYDELQLPPRPAIPSSKKITILEQQIIPKGRKIVFNPTKAPVIIKGNDALTKPLPGLASKLVKKPSNTSNQQAIKKPEETTISASEKSESSSCSTSGESINDRDSDADYKYARDRLSAKSKKSKSVLKGVRKVIAKNFVSAKETNKLSSKSKPTKSLIRQEIKDKIMHKKSKLEFEKKTPPSILSKRKSLPSNPPTVIPPKPELQEESKSELPKPQKIVKKEKKTPAHMTALLSDMTSLFSTPDVIRRVSTDGKTKVDKGSKDSIHGPHEHDNKGNKAIAQPKTYSKNKDRNSLPEVKDMETIPQIDDASLAQLLQGPTNMSSTSEPSTGLGVATTTTANPLSSPNLGPLSPTLDLLAGLQPEEEGLTEDLLMHVAQLVESSENLQEVIDKQVLGKVDSVIPKAPVSPAVTAQSYAQASAAAKMRVSGPRKDPIQIVRSDGRIITLPPIEAPTTRSSMRKTQGPVHLEQLQEVPPQEPQPIIPTPEPVLVQATPKQYSNKKLSLKKTETSPETAVPAVKLLQESEDSMNSEDDPYRLWCICKQPHNNRFMICCDRCEDWFHGKCVNITKAMGQQMEEQGVEWTCPNCIKKITTPKSKSMSGKRPDSASRSTSTPPPACIVCGRPARASSIYCSDACITRHAQESISPAPAVKTDADKAESRIIVFERKTGRVLQGSSAPTSENLKSWLQEHPTFEVVRRERENKPMVNVKNPLKSPKIQTTLKYDKQQKQIILLQPQPKPPQLNLKPVKSAALSPQDVSPKTPLSIKPNAPRALQLKQTLLTGKDGSLTPKVTTPTSKHSPLTPKQGQPTPKLIPTSPMTPDTKKTPGKITLVRSQSTTEKSIKSPTPVTRVRREREPESKPRPISVEPIRDNVRKALQEHMMVRLAETKGVKFTSEDIKKFAVDTELEMFNMFKDVSVKYKAKYRSLIFNIKDRKNLSLWQKICDRSLTPKQLVHMSPEELASQELAQWRDKESKHQLELIKKNELDLMAASKTYVLKTHKGEEVMEQKSVAADVDPNVSVEDLVTVLNDSATAEDGDFSKEDKSKQSKLNSRKKNIHHDAPTRSSSRHKKSKEERNKDKKKEKTEREDKDRSTEERRSRRDRHRSRDRTRDRSRQRADKKKTLKTGSRSRDRSRHRSRSRGRSRTRRRDSPKPKADKRRSQSQEQRPRSLSQENDYHSKDKFSSKETEVVERPKSAMQKESHPEYDPHEPMITSAFSEEDLRRSREASFDEGYLGEEVPQTIDNEEYDPAKTLSFDVDAPAIAGSSRINRIPSEVESDQEPSSTVDSAAPPVWNGLVNMVDVARFYVDAHQVSGSCSDLEEDLCSELEIVGRINPDTVWDYIRKMKRTSNKDILVLKLTSSAVATVEERMQYIALYSYLSSRNRLGVVKVTNTSVKDFYIFPLAATDNLPSVLLPLEGPGLDDARTHLLFALIVRQKKKRQATSKLETLPSKVVKNTRKRSYTPPVAGESYTPPTSPAPSRRSNTLRLPLPFVPPTPELSSSVKDKIAASLASAEGDEAYSPGGSSPGSSAESDSLRSRVDEINRQIEEQKQQILSIATTVHQSQEDEAYSPSRPMTPPRGALADIALPSNLQEILATIQQRSGTQPPAPPPQPPPPPPPSDVDMRIPPPPPGGHLHTLTEEQLLRMVPDDVN